MKVSKESEMEMAELKKRNTKFSNNSIARSGGVKRGSANMRIVAATTSTMDLILITVAVALLITTGTKDTWIVPGLNIYLILDSISYTWKVSLPKLRYMAC